MIIGINDGFLFCFAGDPMQGLTQAKQGCTVSHTPVPVFAR